jgi:hypothetical protein
MVSISPRANREAHSLCPPIDCRQRKNEKIDCESTQREQKFNLHGEVHGAILVDERGLEDESSAPLTGNSEEQTNSDQPSHLCDRKSCV